MADNLTTTTTVSTVPSGTVISTDDAGASGHVQRVKLAYSADGVATHAQVDVDGVLVNLGTNNDVTVTGTVDLGATDNAVLDTIASNTGTGAVVGTGTEAAAMRVTIATDSTGVLSVDDNGSTLSIDDGGSSITVDGTVAVSGTVTVDTELPTAAAMADAAANPTVPAVGARNSVYNGSTWDRMRGNTVGTYVHGGTAHDAVDAGNPVKMGGKAYNFDGTVPGTAVAENDRANFITDVYGRQFVETAHPNYWRLSSDYATAQTNASLKTAPGAGLKLYITDVIISNGATAGNITLLDGSGGTVLLEIYPAINGGVAMPFRTPIALTANTALVITSTTVTTHSVTVTGYTAP